MKTSVKRLIQIVSIFLVCQSALASETDNFTRRNLEVDAQEWLNLQMNEAIQNAVQKADPNVPYSVHKILFKSLGGVFWAKIEKWSDNPVSPAEQVQFEESIFRDVGHFKGTSSFIRRLVKFKSYYSPGIYRMGDTVFGADKLGHFLQLGYSMYLADGQKRKPEFKDVRPLFARFADVISGDAKFRKQLQSKGLDLAYEYSHFQENGEWGLKGPMARSWADMAANVEGYKFWSELTGGSDPYVKKGADGRWVQVKKFDWGRYVTPAWDEAVNHTDYDERFHDQVVKRSKEAMEKSGYTLPSIQSIYDKYGLDTNQVFNNQCSKIFVF
ncbi:hypothetical protein [Bdellovibrio sp. KM01]|uniref:hypothetical protein n=1 Tax=Bdellovibrio sp. KM01 TaxID=2748865 RepID=UPI0015E91E12|nr:hypothetical protein [Bdellovibrio sp. KM01]QLY25127.1 hypothetical protein HW988_17170 [Bdellovibrio sp. KM01]